MQIGGAKKSIMRFSDEIGSTGVVVSGIFLAGSSFHFVFGRKPVPAEVPPFPDPAKRSEPELIAEPFSLSFRNDEDDSSIINGLFAELNRDGLFGLRVEVPNVPSRRAATRSFLSSASAQWEAHELVRLLVACAYLRSETLHSGSKRKGESIAFCGEDLSISQVIVVARERAAIRQALFSYAAGGADRLFEAYEAVGSEIKNCTALDYGSGIGAKEWMVEQGWMTEEEYDRFLDITRRGTPSSQESSSDAAAPPLSPRQAQQFVRRVLMNLIGYLCIREGT